MREIIARVVGAEAAAREQVAHARAEAEGLVVEARRRAQEIGAGFRDRTRAEVEALQAATINDAEATRRERLTAAAAELDATIHIDDAVRSAVVAEAIRCVTGGRCHTR